METVKFINKILSKNCFTKIKKRKKKRKKKNKNKNYFMNKKSLKNSFKQKLTN